MRGYLIVFLGAGLGGAARHGVNALAVRLLSFNFPYGTLAVNIAGSLMIGLLVGWFAHKADPGHVWRQFLTTGILGGFTTFSAFSLEVALMWERGEFVPAGIYILASVGLSLLGLFAGLALIRAVT